VARERQSPQVEAVKQGDEVRRVVIERQGAGIGGRSDSPIPIMSGG